MDKKETIVAMATKTKGKVVSPNAPQKIVAKVDFARLYDNKLSTNIVDMEKDFAKDLKTQVKDLMDSIAKKNKNTKHIQVIYTAEEKATIKNAIAKALNVEVDKISNSMIEKAVVSGMTNKFVKAEKGVKKEGWSYSVSAFLKSINASVFKTVER